MKVFEYRNPNWGIVFKKISHFLRKFAPENVIWVDDLESSDLQIIHIVGTGEIEIAEKSPKKVIFQHCLKTAGDFSWDVLWKNSLLTVSFHDLTRFSKEHFQFLHMPWGYDEALYFPERPFEERSDVVFVTGHIAQDESIDVIFEACKEANYLMLHTGENFRYDPKYYKFLHYMPEEVYASMLRNIPKYVFGLRKVEGFEVAVLEGIASGAVGVVPTLSSYDWYDGLALRIDVESSNLFENIYNILRNKEKIVPNDKILQNYTWQNIMTRFWNFLWQLLKK